MYIDYWDNNGGYWIPGSWNTQFGYYHNSTSYFGRAWLDLGVTFTIEDIRATNVVYILNIPGFCLDSRSGGIMHQSCSPKKQIYSTTTLKSYSMFPRENTSYEKFYTDRRGFHYWYARYLRFLNTESKTEYRAEDIENICNPYLKRIAILPSIIKEYKSQKSKLEERLG